ncbi:hypothetical protein FA95DRAFT_1347056 [Auriscalpium vulgare]|uniref:Uncharacterized protein n=1 Tax=Auriscalpium vulgare TaxID=40419 RepID=A0ACB8RRE4_9AGAM|nr:hypothetical protein FA95DRAFT_1347056 [Auriscalpium vulgare]
MCDRDRDWAPLRRAVSGASASVRRQRMYLPSQVVRGSSRLYHPAQRQNQALKARAHPRTLQFGDISTQLRSLLGSAAHLYLLKSLSASLPAASVVRPPTPPARRVSYPQQDRVQSYLAFGYRRPPISIQLLHCVCRRSCVPQGAQQGESWLGFEALDRHLMRCEEPLLLLPCASAGTPTGYLGPRGTLFSFGRLATAAFPLGSPSRSLDVHFPGLESVG